MCVEVKIPNRHQLRHKAKSNLAFFISLLSHPGHQRSQLPPLNGTGVTLCFFCPYSTSQARAFSVVGPSLWNGLPLAQRMLPKVLSDTYYSSLKTVLFSRARVASASE